MIVKVNEHKCEIVKTPVNEKEINITKVEFEFADVITDEYVKEAYFTLNGETYKQIIVNNGCDIPNEVLTEKGQVEIGIVAYLVENEQEIKRYNPSPAYFETWIGSLKDAENSEPITPSEMEQYEQALQDGLSEVNDKIEEIDTALEGIDNIDVDIEKDGDIAYFTITKKDGTQETTELTAGLDGITPHIGDNGNWYLDEQDTGKPSRGENGTDGFSPIATVTKSENITTISITDKNGTTTASVINGSEYDDTEIRNILNNKADISDIPDVSNFITNTVDNLVNYYTKTETYTKTEVNNLIGKIATLQIQVVNELPQVGDSKYIYLVPSDNPKTQNIKDEYIWANNNWEQIGSTEIDLTGYATESWVNTQIANFLTESDVNSLISAALTGYALKSEIPNDLADLNDDSTHRLVTDTEKTVWSGKQNVLTFDNTPTQNSDNPVKSGGIYTYVNTLIGDINSAIDLINGEVI